MFTRLRTHNFGPSDLDIAIPDAKGCTVIRGPSMAGKSTVIDAILAPTIGVDRYGRAIGAEHVRGADWRIELTTAAGTRIERTATTRTRTPRDGVPEVMPSAQAMRDALGKWWSDPTLTRLIVAPLAWCDLAAGNGRALRDVITGLLPAADLLDAIRAEGIELRKGDVLEEAAVYDRRAAANKARDEAAGALSAAEAAARGPLDTAVEPYDIGECEALIARGRAWQWWDALAIQRADESARLAEWRARRDALGARPDGDAGAAEALAAAKQARASAADAVAVARAAGVTAKARLEQARAGKASTCPTCGQLTPAPTSADVVGLEHARNAAATVYRTAEAELKRAEAALDAVNARQSADPSRAWDEAIALLGREPRVTGASEAPAGNRPTEADLEEARATLAAATRAEGARVAQRAERERAGAALAAATERHRVMAAEARRLDRLLDALRTIPSRLAAEQSAALGDLGPVSFVWGAEKFEVKISGRDWRRASRGELIHASLWLQAGLRRLAGLGALPVIVDDAGLWSGAWPALPGPIWRLETRGGAVEVSRG